ncbi:unannotated protein [freshwater metagenome]|uniref:Unannotated protein n=1 Tax=freshwater metagenome TaxID=449393 RepID=A0A6J7GL19_9ZZZZ|nr:hypothetical protein [Actinomycetota bacterium]MSY78310.1 hypothetical protein [Actinomycetota bacterium]
MTIKKGESWGEPGELEDSGHVVASDIELAELLQSYRDSQQVAPVIGLVGGSLHRTLGAPQRDESALRSGQGYQFSIDVGILGFQDPLGESNEVLFVAHMLALTDSKMRLWKGRTVIAMNAGFVGDLNLGPRSHPNDGRLDVTDGQLVGSQRKQALRRAPSGTHVPHPDLVETRVRSRVEVSGDTRFQFCADGKFRGCSSQFWIMCLPDAAQILV